MSSVGFLLDYPIDVSTRITRQNPDYRLKMFEALRRGDITITPCDLKNLLQIETVPKKSSASSSVIVIGNVKYAINGLADSVRSPRMKKSTRKSFDDEVLMKLSFNSKDYDIDNSLLVEMKIYEIATSLVKRYATPHLMTYIGAFQCPNFIEEFSRQFPLQDDWVEKYTAGETYYENTKDGRKTNIKPIKDEVDPRNWKIVRAGLNTYYKNLTTNKVQTEKPIGFYEEIVNQIISIEEKDNRNFKIYDFNRANVLLLEKGRGMSLSRALSNIDFTEDELIIIIFQVLYTLCVLYKNDVQHNDLHLGNIFIQTIDPAIFTYQYVFPDGTETEYSMRSKYLPKLFDFDQSFTSQYLNTKLDNVLFCEEAGICNKKNPKFDTYLFLIQLGIALSDFDDIGDFIERHIGRELLELGANGEWPFAGRLCKLVRQSGRPNKCDGPWTPPPMGSSPLGMSTPEEMLRDPIFRKFHTPPGAISRYVDVFSNIK